VMMHYLNPQSSDSPAPAHSGGGLTRPKFCLHIVIHFRSYIEV